MVKHYRIKDSNEVVSYFQLAKMIKWMRLGKKMEIEMISED